MRTFAPSIFLCWFILISISTQGQSDSIYEKGQYYSTLGIYDLALEHYLQALTSYEAEENRRRIGHARNAIGLVYLKVGNLEEAQKYLTTALANAKAASDSICIAYVYNNLGMLAQNQRQSDSASYYYQLSLECKRLLRDTIGMSRSLTNLGTVEIGAGNYRAALKLYFEAIPYKLAVQDSAGLSTLYCNIGDAYGNLGILDSTKLYLQRGFAIAEATQNLPALAQYYRNFSALYSELDSLPLVVHYYELFFATQDSLFHQSLSEELARQEVNYQLDTKKKELEIVEARNVLLEKENEVERKTRMVMWLIVGLLVLGLALLYLIIKFRNRTLTQERHAHEQEQQLAAFRLKQEQDQKKQLALEKDQVQRELLFISMQTLKKREVLSELQENIEKASRDTDATSRKVLDETHLLLKRSLEEEDDWTSFKLHFEQVHPKFFQNLASQFPKLTQTDHRHVAYIRIGLTTKEIARLMNITPESVQKSRVRLKKKLSLEREDDLAEFVRAL